MTYKLKRYIWICPVLWMIIIFLFSHQPGNQSAHLSGSLTQFLVRFFEIISIELDWIRLHSMIRVLAHFTIFFVLGLLWYITLRIRNMPIGRAAITAFCISLGYALFDEIHQFFVPGRACDIKDVMVDSVGSGIAITISWILDVYKF